MKAQWLELRRTPVFAGLLATLAGWDIGIARSAFGQDSFAVPLPEPVKAVWDLGKAYRETTPTREKICINGLWRWQPAASSSETVAANGVPNSNWGYFKVPGCWPGITDYLQKDFQTVHAHPSWKSEQLRNLSAAWYERTISVPQEWTGRRIALSVEYLNSFATVFVDGAKCAEIRFPSGECDLTAHVRPGSNHVVTLLVVAMPLKGVLLSYTDSNAAREVKGKVERRGLCGDVFLVSTPSGARISNMRVETSVRRREITFDVPVEGLQANIDYILGVRIMENRHVIKEFMNPKFRGSPERRMTFTQRWMPEKLWDLHTPQNKYDVEVSLLNADGKALDVQSPVEFGFREFWIDGRDFYLNGSRIFLSAVPLDNAQVGAALATYDAARETLERLKSFGINYVYTHNYGCEPGSHLSFAEILRAADDVGMLVGLSQPHFSHYEWRSPEADQTNGYARHAEFYVRAAQNHPSVIAYAMSHNATGYEEDMNPDLIDGISNPRDQWSERNAKIALRAEAIVKALDPGRTVYHHASGNLGSMHAINFYPNFVPIQELSDWFEHWATKGVKPVFTCEYGAPFTWDWTMYRGWYRGQREWGSAVVPWEFCLAEWNAQFLGDAAFKISPMEAANLRWEAKQFRAGKLWHRWDYPYAVGSSAFEEQYPVFATYLNDNWRAFRTWGVSAISPWEYGHYWRLRKDVDKRRKELKLDWENLQRPGFSPDYLDQYERMDLGFERSDWIPTAAAQALLRNNGPLLAYLAGKPEHFTSKDHNFFPGETVEKQLILINNSRQTVSCEFSWSFGLPKAISGSRRLRITTGQQERVPLRFALPNNLSPGKYELASTFRFSNGQTQSDSLTVHVLPHSPASHFKGSIALFDPKGETRELLKGFGIVSQPVDETVDLSRFDMLVVGKAALTVDGKAPDITRVRDGLKVLMFEQTPDVLEKRFGFRVEEYGLRQVFARVPDHPALAGIGVEHWRDWRGEATILAPRLKYELRPRYGPTVKWCDIPVTRLWRCGNRGNVASVVIEKPPRGNFLPVIDGGYSLQYSPLMEFREGQGLILFCQMDVTGRTESEPAAQTLVRNIFEYMAGWKPAPSRTLVYVGSSAGKRHLEAAGFAVSSYDGGKLSTNQVLVVASGGETKLSNAQIDEWLNAGGTLLTIGIDQQEASAVLSVPVTFKAREHISVFFEAPGVNSVLSGIAPADVHNRDPRELPLVSSGATVLGDGILGTAMKGHIVFCQVVPWQFDPIKQSNLKRTYRRASFLLTRLLSNLRVSSVSPILTRFKRPADAMGSEKRWLTGLYLDQPEEWDDPYRFFRW